MDEEKSLGHVCFVGPGSYNPQRYELFIGENGSLYKAPANYPLDIWGYRQGARWEAPPHYVEQRVKMLQEAFTL